MLVGPIQGLLANVAACVTITPRRARVVSVAVSIQLQAAAELLSIHLSFLGISQKGTGALCGLFPGRWLLSLSVVVFRVVQMVAQMSVLFLLIAE